MGSIPRTLSNAFQSVSDVNQRNRHESGVSEWSDRNVGSPSLRHAKSFRVAAKSREFVEHLRSSKRLLVGALFGNGRVNAGQAMQKAGGKGLGSSRKSVVEMGKTTAGAQGPVMAEALQAGTLRVSQRV